MAEEIKRQAEEAAKASMEAESEAGAVSEEETAQDTQTGTAENAEQQSDSEASEDCGGCRCLIRPLQMPSSLSVSAFSHNSR